MYVPDFLDGFDRLVAFDAETTGKRTPDAEFVCKQPFAWRAPAIIIEVGRELSAAPIANFALPSAPGRIPIERRLLQPPRHHSALGVVTALSQPFDQLPGV